MAAAAAAGAAAKGVKLAKSAKDAKDAKKRADSVKQGSEGASRSAGTARGGSSTPPGRGGRSSSQVPPRLSPRAPCSGASRGSSTHPAPGPASSGSPVASSSQPLRPSTQQVSSGGGSGGSGSVPARLQSGPAHAASPARPGAPGIQVPAAPGASGSAQSVSQGGAARSGAPGGPSAPGASSGAPPGGAAGLIGSGGAGAQQALVPRAQGPDEQGSDRDGGKDHGRAGEAADGARRGALGGAVKGAVMGAAGGPAGMAAGAAKGAVSEGARGAAASAATGSKVGTRGPGGDGGAIGTGARGQDEDGKRRKSTTKRVVRAGAANTAASPATGGTLSMLALLSLLKNLLLSAVAAVVNAATGLWSMLWGLVSAGLRLAFAPAIWVGTHVVGAASALLGVTVPAAATSVGSVVSALVAAALAVAGVVSAAGTTDEDAGTGFAACQFSSTASVGDSSSIEVGGTAEANAQRIYSVLRGMGMSATNIAGILGNWSVESGIDPTSVEGVFDEPYQVGPTKQGKLSSGFTGGIGLGQWTASRNTQLRDYASSKGGNWYDLDIQLAFMVDADSGAGTIQEMISTEMRSPGEAAQYFHDKWERSADGASGLALRRTTAEAWYARMSGWSVSSDALAGVQTIVGSSLVGMVTQALRTMQECDEESMSSGWAEAGLTQQQAEELMALYNSEGDAVLRSKFSGGGPGQCDGNYVQNCVSFSWYFLVKYTNYFDGGHSYLAGNGRDVAGNLARELGREASSTPSAYSVFSHGNSSVAGHTGVVLAVDGDRLLIGEAGYCSYDGRARWVEASEWKGKGWTFTSVADMLGDAGGDPSGLTTVKSGKSSNKIVAAAQKWLGTPYVWGGGSATGPTGGGFDCSGLVLYAYAQVGVTLPHYSGQIKSAGTVIPKSQAKAGDVVWWPGHVAIYEGNNRVIHASTNGGSVTETELWGSPTFIRIKH